jgi:hypothetical protein
VATAFISLLNVLAVGLLWLFARRYYGGMAAFSAALLFACSPWAVIYSRKIWAQDMLAPFVVATVFSGVLGFLEGRHRWQLVHIVLLALTVQIHYGAFVLIPVSAVLILLGRRHIGRTFWIGIALALLLALPFGVGLVRGALNGGTLSTGGERPPIGIDGQALYHAALTVSGTEIHSLAGSQAYQSYLDSVLNVFPLLNIINLLVILAALYLLRGNALDRVIVLWLALPVLIFSVRWTPSYPHYMIPMLPAAFLVIGIGLEKMAQHRALQVSAILGCIVLALVQVGLLVALLHFVDITPTPGGFGTPLHYLEAARADLSTAPDVIVYSDGDSTTYDETPAVWKVLLADNPSVRFVNLNRMMVIPSNGLLLTNGEFRPILTQFGAIPGKAYPMRGDEPPYQTFTAPSDLIKAPDAITLTLPQSGIMLENGAALTGAWVVRRENTLRLYTAWWLSQEARDDATLYSVFNHLDDASGKRLAQQDGPFWKRGYWRTGDRVYQWYDVPFDPAQLLQGVKWQLGMYLNEKGVLRGVNLIDTAGNPVGQIITLAF